MPKIDGIAATKIIKSEFPDIKVLAFTMFDQDEAVSQMLMAGASGYMLKNSSLKDVLVAVKSLSEGKNFYDPNINIDHDDAKSSKKSVLTKRQAEILKLVAQGMTSREIADKLFIGVYTVETHRKNMIRILGLKGNGELLRYAMDSKYDFN